MSLLKLLQLICVLVLISRVGQAQSLQHDFIVKIDGDTLRGELRRGVYSSQATQSITLYQGATAKIYPLAEVAAYGDAYGAVLVSRQVGARGSRAFLRPLVLGPTSLYAGTDTHGETRFYLQPTDSAYVVEVLPTSAQLTFNRLLNGCPILQFGTDETRRLYPYTYRGMRRLVQTYNACRQPNKPLQVVSPGSGWRLGWGLKFGVISTRFDYGSALIGEQDGQDTGFGGGLLLRAHNRSRLSVQLEGTFTYLRSTRSPVAIYTGTSLYTLVGSSRLSFVQFQLPLLLHLQLGHGPVQPYLNAGPSFGLNVANSSRQRYQYSNRSEPENIELVLPARYSLGAIAGAGVLIRGTGRPSFTVEGRIEHFVDAPDYQYYTPTHTSLRLDVGVLF